MSASVGTPADLLKTRMMNQQYINGKGVVYKSTTDCLRKTVRYTITDSLIRHVKIYTVGLGLYE